MVCVEAGTNWSYYVKSISKFALLVALTTKTALQVAETALYYCAEFHNKNSMIYYYYYYY